VEKLPDPVWEKLESLEKKVAALERALRDMRPKAKTTAKRSPSEKTDESI